MEKQSIGKNLSYQRKLKGYTQELLAEKANVAIRTIQRIEKEEVKPQLQTIKLLANALSIEVDELIVLEDPKEEMLQSKWLLFLHASPLLGFIFPFSVLFPLFIWLHKKQDHAVYNSHGVKVINFQLSMTLLYLFSLIALVTIEMWGFLFFMLVFPFNILVVTINIFKAINSHTCFYPLAIPFLRLQKAKDSAKSLSVLLLPLFSLLSCAQPSEDSTYQKLTAYEGTYEFVNGSTLNIHASAFDTTLYAVIDKAKYPLKHIKSDSFVNISEDPVVFERDGSNQVIAYRTDGQLFKRISSLQDGLEMFPRKELFQEPDNYRYQVPTSSTDGLATADLNTVFKKPDLIIDMVKATIKGEYPDVHSILIYKNDQLVLEEYFYGYDAETTHQLRSATKPIIGGILGIAVDQGFINNEHDKLYPYFYATYPNAQFDQKKEKITIENFLQYRHGLDCANNDPESKGNELAMMQSEDWVKYTLDLPLVSTPGTTTSYCSGAALTLGKLVEITTEQKIEDFAQENLFEPMGISNYQWTFEPNQASMNTFSQLYLRPRDLMKLAKLFKDGGRWNERQIISESWVQKTFQMEKGAYGYLWEHKYFNVGGKVYSSYMASGNGGQKINIWPELDMITVFTGGNYNSYQLYGKSTPPNEMIPNYILPALRQ